MTLCCDLLANSYILHDFYGLTYWSMFLSKLPIRLASIPVYAGVIWLVWSRLEKTHVLDPMLNSRKK